MISDYELARTLLIINERHALNLTTIYLKCLKPCALSTQMQFGRLAIHYAPLISEGTQLRINSLVAIG